MNEFLTLLLPWPARAFNPITDPFVYAILLSFIFCLSIFLRKTILRSRLITNLVNEVSKHVQPATPEILARLKEEFDDNSSELAEVWQEFQNSLITREPKENQEKIVYKTDESSLFFSEERLLGQYMNLRFWNSVPALLVGLGILGTFVGLVWGLLPFSNIDFPETENIRSAIQSLLSGVSTAFVTSVWGMLLSLLFNWIEKSGIGRISSKIAVLQRTLDQLFTLTTQEEIAFRQEDELTQQTQALKAFSTDLANEIKSAMAPNLDNLNNVVSEIKQTVVEGNQKIFQELRNAPDAFGSALEEKFAPSFDNLNSAIKALQTYKTESSTDAIQQLVKEFQQSLSGSATEQMKALAETVNKASKRLTTLPEQLDGMMRGVQEQVNQARQLLSETSQNQTKHMKSMMEDMSKAFKEAIDTHQAGLSTTTDSVNQAIADSTARLDDILKSGESRVGKLLQQQEKQIKEVNIQITNSQQTLKKSSEVLKEMDASVTSVRALLKNTKNLSDLLITNSDKLEKASGQLIAVSKTFAEENANHLKAHQDMTKKLLSGLDQSQQLLNDFKIIKRGLQDIFKEIEGGLTNYSATVHASINKYLDEFSEQFAQASKALSEGVSALTDSVEKLTKMPDTSQANGDAGSA